jgi:type I restriction enzyme M protein
MSLTIQSIDTQIAHGGIFHNDRYPELKANYMLTNLPFNGCSWCGELLEDDESWVYGLLGCDVVRGQCAAKNNGEVVHG